MRWRNFLQKYREIYVGSTQLGAVSWSCLETNSRKEQKREEGRHSLPQAGDLTGAGNPRKKASKRAVPKTAS